MSKTIAIIAAPNGARKQKSDHPAVPISTAEIVEDVVACRDAGAAMVHVHARDVFGKHSLDIDDSQKLLEALDKEVGDSVIVQLTTEAVGFYTPQQQMELIEETRPKAASFALRELIPDHSYLAKAERFFHSVAKTGMLTQYILYDREDVERYLSLLRQGVLPGAHRHVLLVLGRYHKQQLSEPSDILPFMLPGLVSNERWGACAFGHREHQCLTTAALLGGDIRVGFENNLMDKSGQLAKDNASQIRALVEQTRSLGVNIHSASSYRSLLENIF